MTRTLSSSSRVRCDGVRRSGASNSIVAGRLAPFERGARPGNHRLKSCVGHRRVVYQVSKRDDNPFNDMDLSVGTRTDTGPRKMNQDHFGTWPDLGLYVVADGMGGHNAGEVASHLAVETIYQFIAESARTADLTWPFGLEVARSIDMNRLTTAVRLANRRIYDEGSKHAELSGMGTTVVAASSPATG